MEQQYIDVVIELASAAISAVLVYAKTQGKYQKAKKMLKDLVAAIDDDTITEPEAAQLIQDARDIIAAKSY